MQDYETSAKCGLKRILEWKKYAAWAFALYGRIRMSFDSNVVREKTCLMMKKDYYAEWANADCKSAAGIVCQVRSDMRIFYKKMQSYYLFRKRQDFQQENAVCEKLQSKYTYT